MNTHDLNQYIKDLTANDRKTLTQKVAKLFEEGGELAKAILPFEGAYATNHRVVDKRKLLEEAADVYLVNQSILYSLGFSDQEFEDMVFEKAQVWNALQVKEDRSLANGDTMPYEIHITVNAEDGIDIEHYKAHCAEIGVKPIVLALQDQAGSKVMDDVMTSSKFYGNNGEAFEEMKRISGELAMYGYNVIREKIEGSYWHPKAPFRADGDTTMPENCYFECHLNVQCTDDRLQHLSKIAKSTNCHLSSNAFKKFEDGSFTIMMTYRSYDQMFEDFEDHLEFIKNNLNWAGFKLEKEIVEFSIYDTRINHDSKWLEA
jgi:NTP pyrophosphatase (non-canonical NTP hydrolase)